MRARSGQRRLLGIVVVVALVTAAVVVATALADAPDEIQALVTLVSVALSVVTYATMYVLVRRARW